MSIPAAFQATYSDFKLIRTRKVVQVILEVPLEGSEEALRVLGGMPNPAAEIWCAVARLGNGGGAPEQSKSISTDTTPAQSPAARADKRLVRQAAMCCTDPVFQKFLIEHGMIALQSREQAEVAVRLICSVKSRTEIIPGTEAAQRWGDLHGKFLAWKPM